MKAVLATLAIVIVARATAAAGPCGEASGCAVTVPGLLVELRAAIELADRASVMASLVTVGIGSMIPAGRLGWR